MIKELNDLVHFIKTSIWRDEQLLAFFTSDQPGLLELYQAIWKDNLHTDHAAAKAAGMGLTTYKKRARALRRRLRTLAVFFDDEKSRVDATVNNYIEGALETALLQLLHARGYRHAPLEIAKRLYRRGRDYEVPAFVVEALRVLKESVLSVGGTEKQFEAYSREFWAWRDYSDAEERAVDCYQWTQLPALQKREIREQLLSDTRRRLDALAPLKCRAPSYLFHLHYFSATYHFLLETADWEKALACCDEAIGYFQARKYPAGVPLAFFSYSKVPVFTLQGRYAEGEAAVLTALDFAPDGSFHFFAAYERYFTLAMHTGHYEQALDIFQTVRLHKRFSGTPPAQQEVWHILGACLHIFYRLKRQEWQAEALPVFRSIRFANETPVFNQDKTGMNVAIQIALTLLQLLEGRQDAVLERIQTLEKYRLRYLRDTRADRSTAFIRILACLPKSGFRSEPFLRKAQPLLIRMAGMQRQLNNRHSELEIIPYDTLTTLIGEYLR